MRSASRSPRPNSNGAASTFAYRGDEPCRSPSFDCRCLLRRPLVAADWPLHRGNATQTGVSDEKLPDKLAIRWEFKTKNAVEGAVVIADGVVYAGVGRQVPVRHRPEDRARRSGRPSSASSPRRPGCNGNRVYVGDVDGKFYCLDRANGAVLWTFETEGPDHRRPELRRRHVLIPAHDSTLYCLDKDGKKVWDFRIEGPIYGGVAVADGKTFLAGLRQPDARDRREDRQGTRQRGPERPERRRPRRCSATGCTSARCPTRCSRST